MNKKIILAAALLIVAIAVGTATVYKKSGANGVVKESFYTFGACACPPDDSDKPEIISIRNKVKYEQIKAEVTYDKQHCSPTAGCSVGHSITYRYIE